LESALTEFAQETRHYCRNPRCRSKLSAPVSNPREAFCARGCYNSFHLHRCRVCEGPIEQPKHGTRSICKKSKCRNTWKAGLGFGRYADPQNANPAQETLVPQRSAAASKPDRPWHIVAGPELTLSQFHCAIVPDGPDCQWKGGEYERTEAKNGALLKAHAARAIFQPNHRPADILGGDRPMYRLLWLENAQGKKFPGSILPDPVIPGMGYDRPEKLDQKPVDLLPIPDDLSIPAFLRRGAA
jgi:hypothetical protein